MRKNFYYKFLSLFSGFKPQIKEANIVDFNVKIREDALEYPTPAFTKLQETYALIKKLLFQPEININIMQNFKSLLKWNDLNLHCSTSIRNYPLGFEAEMTEFTYSDLHLPERTKPREEIVQILPYVKEVDNKKLFKLPIIKRPVYKSYFSREQMRLLREKIAIKNKSGWANVEIFDVYDKFHHKFFSNIKQVPDSKNLEYTPNIEMLDKMPEKTYFLVIGKNRNTGAQIKSIINPSDIQINDYK